MSTSQSPFLTEDEAADLLRLSPDTLKNWRNAGNGPPNVRVGPKRGKVLYDREAVIAWVRSNSGAPAEQGVA